MNRVGKRQQARQGKRCRVRREAPKRVGCVGVMLDLFFNGKRVKPSFPRLRVDKRKRRRMMRKRFMGGMITISVSSLEAEKFCYRYIKPLPYRDELDNFPDEVAMGGVPGFTDEQIRQIKRRHIHLFNNGYYGSMGGPYPKKKVGYEENYSALKELILGRHMHGEGLWRHPDESYEAFRKRVLDKLKAEYDV